MSSEKTEGMVIRQADFSETSRVLTLFTRDFGKIAVIAKGAKRLKGPFEAALDLLTVVNIVFIRKSSGGLDILTEAQLRKRFTAQGKSLESVYAGYYVAELLAALTEEYDPHPELYDEALRTLDWIAEPRLLHLAVVHFELALLQEIGQLPMFDACVLCGREVGSDGWYGFKSGQGVVCQTCLGHDASQRRLSAGTLALLQKLLADTDAWQRLAVSPEQFREMRLILVPAISHPLGKRPKMLSFLKFPAPA